MYNMDIKTKNGLIDICDKISECVKKDVTDFEGKEFNALNIATYLGYQSAAINTLSIVLKKLIEQTEVNKLKT